MLKSLLMILLPAFVLFAADEPAAPPPVYTSVTVTAERGTVVEAGNAAQVVSVAEPETAKPVIPTTGHALDRQPSVLVQQTGPGQVSPFLRGLTGYHVLNLIDGVRFNNSAFRSGPNQYLAYVEPSSASAVEVVLGPSSSQYGSDALGGVIGVQTRRLAFADSLSLGGDLRAWGSSAELSTGVDADVFLTGARWAWLIGGSGAKQNDIRTGGGIDTRNVYRRFFGVDLIGGRLPGTAWSRTGLHTKGSLAVARESLLTVWFQRSDLDGLRNYKDLTGGLGRLESRLDPQTLDFGYVRFERLGKGVWQSLSATASVNSQSDGSVRQGQRYTDPLIQDRVRLRGYGYSALAAARVRQRHSVVFGTDVHDEHVDASRVDAGRPVRALYPPGARYTTYAGFVQGSSEYKRLRMTAGGRGTGVSYEAPAAPAFGVAGTEQSFGDWTWHVAASVRVAGPLAVHAIASRGFRAPNLNDLGAIGLNDLGYEVPAVEAAGAVIGSSAGEAATPTARSVSALVAERLRNFEMGVRFRTSNLYARVQGWQADLIDPIDRRTLLFPVSAVPSSVAGLRVAPLAPVGGFVPMATALDPRAVKAFVNDGRFRYYGNEILVEYRVRPSWMLRGNYAFIHGRQLNPNRFVRRLPPQMGHAAVLYNPGGRRYWIEARGSFAGEQSRLSGGDLDDERIGASRSRRDIASFFGSAIASPYVNGGVFIPTGETLSQVQARVLPRVTSETLRVPMFATTPGWARFDVLGGFRASERMTVYGGVENLFDRTYRVHGSGLDGLGVNVSVRVRYSF